MTYEEQRQQRVNRADLNAGATTGVAQLRSANVILQIWADNWQELVNIKVQELGLHMIWRGVFDPPPLMDVGNSAFAARLL